jgi:hypothetical protein
MFGEELVGGEAANQLLSSFRMREKPVILKRSEESKYFNWTTVI